MALSNWRKLRIAAFWATTAFTYGAALMPGDEAPTMGGSDKTDHVAAFLTLTLLARLAYPVAPRWLTFLGLSIYGAWIEISQGMPIFGRDANIWDWVADSLAILVMMLALWPFEKRLPRLFER
ncbi:hypothetical protein [Sphingomonas montanisoli]|uniref:VanZ family protein n=1 Tax=Sphingomonas montanisoli TaxID=2606412 RepID=A0A5D9CAA5_9SPHN|nr:hypothetical protein [Sphingomonas montanisoli]TZG28868.1 hypothetical protein FYJ91_01620 [Sphingomonas montanisoli]